MTCIGSVISISSPRKPQGSFGILSRLMHPEAASLSKGASMEITNSDRDRFWSKVKKSTDCWNWTAAKTKKGYGWFYICGRPHFSHRVSWIIHFGNIPDSICVCHHCDNPLCVNPTHLFLGTNEDNTADRHTKGRSRGAPGTEHGMVKLSETQVRAIQLSPLPSRALGSFYGVSKTQILRIKKGISWKHIHAV